MIKIDALEEIRPNVRYKGGSGLITLDAIEERLMLEAQNAGIPLSLKKDQVKSGGLFNSSVEDCLVLYHPSHENDYFKFCVRLQTQGNYAFVSVYSFGQSKQFNKAGLADAYREDRKGKNLSYQVGSLIGQGIRTLGKNKQKHEEETMYYTCLLDVFDVVIS